MITILKKIINDYCKLTNNNDIKTTILFDMLINMQNASRSIIFSYYVITITIYDTLSRYKNFNSEILLKICKKNLDLWYFEEFDNFLIRRQIKDSFVKNLKQIRNRSLADLMLTIPPIDYINRAFHWCLAEEKRNYWYKYDRMWRTYIRNKIKKSDDIQPFNADQVYMSIFDYLTNKNVQ